MDTEIVTDTQAAPVRTHFNVTVHAYDIGFDAPILVERTDGRIVRAYDVDFGQARCKLFTRTQPEDKLQREGSGHFTAGMTASAVWLEITPTEESEVRVAFEQKGEFVALDDIPAEKWITYGDVYTLGC